MFVIFQGFQERFKPVKFETTTDPLILEELQSIEKYTQTKKNSHE